MIRALTLLILCACGQTVVDGVDDTDLEGGEAFPRCADADPLRRPWFGDTHVHTTLSLDAHLQGTRLGHDDAYRFATGEEVGIQPYDSEGVAMRRLQIDRPLDFVAISDHAEFLGTVRECSTPGSASYDHPSCKGFRDNPDLAFIGINGATTAEPENAAFPDLCGPQGEACIASGMDVWGEVKRDAEAWYDRTDTCSFTTFAAYEWSAGPGTKNLHRNVIFRNEDVPDRAWGMFDAPTKEKLWTALERECLAEPPCDVLTIPHNSNLSSGLMFEPVSEIIDAAAAARRAAREPLVEVFQHKGDSECWPGTTASDELCGFEKLPYNTLAGANLDLRADPTRLDFVRDVLGEGLRAQADLGVNPYKYGIVASSDTHLATPGAVSEAAFPGHGGAGQGNRDELPRGFPDNVQFNPGGLAVLWSEENSREGLFRAMVRKESYGTSGPRIVLRMFGAADLPADICTSGALAEEGYARGVPMGGDLAGVAKPVFVVSAAADAGTEAHPGALLQRIQIVKGWLDGADVQYTVVDLAGDAAWTGADPLTCDVSGEGAGQLCARWVDEAHEADDLAFWYARVVEVPTCRWQQRFCVEKGITCPTDDPDLGGCCADDVPALVQERAWSSPIWAQAADG